MATHQFQPSLPPPSNTTGVVGWLRKNLFNGVFNSIATLVLGYLAIQGLLNILDWAIFNANWSGTTRNDCTLEGACWVFISVRWEQFMYGFYPAAELWRPRLFFFTLALFVALLAYEKTSKRGWFGWFSLTSIPSSLPYFFMVVSSGWKWSKPINGVDC